MKTLKVFIPLLFMFLMNACYIDNHINEDVKACFTVSGSSHYVNEAVYFVNCSQDAYEYEWDFGDGTTSKQRNPTHVFTQQGNYQITMTAFGDYDHDTFTDVVFVAGSTDLDILVMYLGTEDPVSNCVVTLFSTENDWENLTDPIVSGSTGSNGIMLFLNLNPVVYFIDAYKYVSETTYYSNYLQGYATDNLLEDVVNYYNIYVELLNSGKNSERKSVVIRKIEASSKEEHERIINENINKK